MAIAYLNTKLFGKTETIDELDSKDYPSIKDFRQAKKYLISEYSLAGSHGDLYWSQRCTNDWRSR